MLIVERVPLYLTPRHLCCTAMLWCAVVCCACCAEKTPLPVQPPVKELDEDPPSPVSSAGAEYELPVPEASEDKEGRAGVGGEDGGGEEEGGGGAEEELDDEDEQEDEDDGGGDDDDEEEFTMDGEPEEDEVRREEEVIWQVGWLAG